jgi:hypothetical protein
MSSLSLSPGAAADTFESRCWTTMVIVVFFFYYLLVPRDAGHVDVRA